MFCAWASASNANSASARMMSRMPFLLGVSVAADFNAKSGERCLAARARRLIHLHVNAAAMAVHGDDERTEATHAELPQRLRIEIVHVEVLDRLDPGRLERRRAADDREIGAANVLE